MIGLCPPQALASADLWHRKVQMHLRAMDLDVTLPRRHWPLEALRRTFDEMQADSPVDLIARELLLSSLHPGAVVGLRNSFLVTC